MYVQFTSCVQGVELPGKEVLKGQNRELIRKIPKILSKTLVEKSQTCPSNLLKKNILHGHLTEIFSSILAQLCRNMSESLLLSHNCQVKTIKRHYHDIGRKLNAHRTLQRCLGNLQNMLYPVFRGKSEQPSKKMYVWNQHLKH